MHLRHLSLLSASVLVITLASATLARAQSGKLNLRVTPKQAYVFVDDHAMSEASKHPSLRLSAGEHKIELVNYGYLSRPLHFFGRLGLINVSTGSAVALWLLVSKILYRTNVVEQHALLLVFAAVLVLDLRRRLSWCSLPVPKRSVGSLRKVFISIALAS